MRKIRFPCKHFLVTRIEMRRLFVCALLAFSLSAPKAMAKEKSGLVLCGWAALVGMVLTTLIVGATISEEMRCEEEFWPLCCLATIENNTIVTTDCTYAPKNYCSGDRQLFCLDGISQITEAPYQKRKWANRLLYTSIAFLPLALAGSIMTGLSYCYS